jgi:type VI secretion system protein ImpI
MFVLRAFGLSGAPLPAAKTQFQHLPIRIGRNPLNDFVLEFTMISSFHARIEDDNGSVCVRDLGSRNGIFLPSPSGGNPVRIAPNTSVDLGPSNLCFFLSPHVQLRLEVFAQQAPVRNALACGTVLGNLSIASQPGLAAAIPSAPRPPGAPPLPGALATQAFQLDLPTLALMGLREMAGSLIPQRQLETSGDIARFITKLHDAMDVFCRTFIPLRQGYAEFVASLDLQRAASRRSAYEAPSTAALTQARTPEAIAMALLDPKDRSFDGPSAVEGILADLMIHQVALLDGVMEGVRSLLDELSPQSIEQATGSGGAAGLLGTKYKSRWEEFCRRFEKLSEGQQAFSFVFGQDFAEVYRQYWNRKAGSEDAGLRTERPPG